MFEICQFLHPDYQINIDEAIATGKFRVPATLPGYYILSMFSVIRTLRERQVKVNDGYRLRNELGVDKTVAFIVGSIFKLDKKEIKIECNNSFADHEIDFSKIMKVNFVDVEKEEIKIEVEYG